MLRKTPHNIVLMIERVRNAEDVPAMDEVSLGNLLTSLKASTYLMKLSTTLLMSFSSLLSSYVSRTCLMLSYGEEKEGLA